MGKAIIFRALDIEIARAEWYRTAKGLKAQTVAYTLAAAAHSFRLNGMQIDLMRIWREQSLPDALKVWLLELASRMHKMLNAPPGQVKNPSEFAKKDFCWTDHAIPIIQKPPSKICEYGTPLHSFHQGGSGGYNDQKGRDVEFDIALSKLVPKVAELRQLAQRRQLISGNNTSALDKLQSGRLTLSKAEKNALKRLLDRLDIDLSGDVPNLR